MNESEIQEKEKAQSEEKTIKEEQTKDGTNKEFNEGDKLESTKLIDDANLAAKRLEDANEEKRKLLNREEALMARKALGGITEAGIVQKKEEISNEQFANDFRDGKIKENILFPNK